jgi:hypothetical protein
MTGLPGGPHREDVDRIVEGVVHIGTEEAIRLAHEAIERFPDLKKKHMFIAGGAALSSALLIGAAVAITKRIRAGQTPQEAADAVTEEELDGVDLLERRRRRPAEASSAPAGSAEGASEQTAGDAEGEAKAAGESA